MLGARVTEEGHGGLNPAIRALYDKRGPTGQARQWNVIGANWTSLGHGRYPCDNEPHVGNYVPPLAGAPSTKQHERITKECVYHTGQGISRKSRRMETNDKHAKPATECQNRCPLLEFQPDSCSVSWRKLLTTYYTGGTDRGSGGIIICVGRIPCCNSTLPPPPPPPRRGRGAPPSLAAAAV